MTAARQRLTRTLDGDSACRHPQLSPPQGSNREYDPMCLYKDCVDLSRGRRNLFSRSIDSLRMPFRPLLSADGVTSHSPSWPRIPRGCATVSGTSRSVIPTSAGGHWHSKGASQPACGHRQICTSVVEFIRQVKIAFMRASFAATYVYALRAQSSARERSCDRTG
jgi:hypothetical protein